MLDIVLIMYLTSLTHIYALIASTSYHPPVFFEITFQSLTVQMRINGLILHVWLNQPLTRILFYGLLMRSIKLDLHPQFFNVALSSPQTRIRTSTCSGPVKALIHDHKIIIMIFLFQQWKKMYGNQHALLYDVDR